MSASKPHSEHDPVYASLAEEMCDFARDIVTGWVAPNVAGDVLKLKLAQALLSLEEQLETLREQHDVELDELRMQVVEAENDAREFAAKLSTLRAVAWSRRWGNGAARREFRRILDDSIPATSPMAESYPPPEDVERAGELSRERGWKDIGGQGVVSDPASEPEEA